MAQKIIASKVFLKKVTVLNSYLENKWGISTASEFHEILLHKIIAILKRLSIGSVSAKKVNVRKIIITKYNRLYYRTNTDKSITLLTLFDNRLNLKKNRYD